MKKTYIPTDEMANQASIGLDFRKKYKRGGTPVGIARARDIKNKKNLPITTVARMYSFFKRHVHDKEAEGWNIGEEGYPSNGLIADKLWGGRLGEEWATRIWEKYKEDKKNSNFFESLFSYESSEEVITAVLKSMDHKNDI